MKRDTALQLIAQQPVELQQAIVANLLFRDRVHVTALRSITAGPHPCSRTKCTPKDFTPELVTQLLGYWTPFSQTVPLLSVRCHGKIDHRTPKELHYLATHAEAWSSATDKCSVASKQALGIPLHTSETRPVLIGRATEDVVTALRFGIHLSEADMSHWPATNKPREQRFLTALLEFLGDNTKFDPC